MMRAAYVLPVAVLSFTSVSLAQSKTAPGRGWFAYMRIYGPEQAAFDRSWKPGDFEVVK